MRMDKNAMSNHRQTASHYIFVGSQVLVKNDNSIAALENSKSHRFASNSAMHCMLKGLKWMEIFMCCKLKCW